ncbi:pumilio homolog 6, chloroplastic-like isoform X1 [Vigna unguiculata]|uniref:pumilio homolog 6, chloroplastic-like isoform X1 n=1 Tax=Vigna unguiculata TaxID=3917 RepID=UPI0010168975|nr:pumilio homolog 6, chloroplastic-like isoform X1 [Vigna unguiculata]XP_027915577.1 pumilio homolog 6, chloroplastic-like isoform X1 [Vigna unguiculata]XP_027915578.1 pumilio homolog 6, chloroplastic-like isoform X1 [Vigna unguiculata]
MATESPIRISEAGGKWPTLKEAATFGSPSHHMATEDLGIFLNGHRFHGSGKDVVPNRSGSAPPSMEGSFHAIENLLSQNTTRNASLGSLNRAVQKYDSGKGSFHLSRETLATHKEEAEDDSTQQLYDNELDKASGKWHRQDVASTSSKHKKIVLEDLPHAMSPVHNKSLGVVDELIDVDTGSNSSYDPSISTVDAIKPTIGGDDTRVSSFVDYSAPVTSSSSLNSTGSMGFNDLDVTVVESQLRALTVSNLPNSESQSYEDKWKNSLQNSLTQQRHQQSYPCETPSNSQSEKCAYIGMEQPLQSSSKFSSDVQPVLSVLQSSGYTPPLYATAAAYMTSTNPFYTNFQASGIYSPSYVGAYPFSPTAVPPYIAAYPPHGSVPLVDGATGSSFTPQAAGVSSIVGSISHSAEMIHANKVFGQFGFPPQPSFGEPFYMQYHQQPFMEGYNIPGHLLAPRASVGGQIGPFDSQKRPNSGSYLDEKKLHNQRSGANLNSNRGGIMHPGYFGHHSNMAFATQYPSSPLSRPVLSGYPESSSGLPGGRNERRPSPASGRNGGLLSGWQSQRALDSGHNPKIAIFLEELKSGKGRRFELSDIIGHIVEFSTDQHGSRFIQQKLENCGVEEKELVFKEVLPHTSKLMTDVFGNYVIQKFFEYGSPEQRKELANCLLGQILPLSLQMYGCRVIQKALEVINLEQKVQLVHELDGNVMRCVRDQNGNHVIQKCIESIPTKSIDFIISAFRGQVAILSMHPYGCRVIQRVLEHCSDEVQCQFIVDEILQSVFTLAQDQYGNYVAQHVLERGRPQERSQIISKLSGHIVQLSQHKFASNVVEKCLEYGDSTERQLLITEIIGHDKQHDNLLTMMKDQFANYVIQRVLEICSESQRAVLLSRIRLHAHALKKYTYGKHIVARCEQLLEEENQSPGP